MRLLHVGMQRDAIVVAVALLGGLTREPNKDMKRTALCLQPQPSRDVGVMKLSAGWRESVHLLGIIEAPEDLLACQEFLRGNDLRRSLQQGPEFIPIDIDQPGTNDNRILLHLWRFFHGHLMRLNIWR